MPAASVKVSGFQTGDLLQGMAGTLQALSADQRAAEIKKINAVYMLNVSADDHSTSHVWVIDLKKEGKVTHGASETEATKGQPKPGIQLTLADGTFAKLFHGKSDPTAEYMSGKLKIKGNMMLGMKLQGALKRFKNLAKSVSAPAISKESSATATTSTSSPTVVVDGFQGSQALAKIQAGLASLSDDARAKTVDRVNGVIQIDLTDGSGKQQSWTLALKKGSAASKSNELVRLGDAKRNGLTPNVILALKDADFVSMVEGKLDGQTAFMTGRLKTKGNMMLAMKLQDVLKVASKNATKARL
ncbi:hypothetical protein EV182_003670 [Spiromyces aspiralis]|uniref:Uncharacterized protein n=1 Tax=Spiromyces aspiralis TaxID=68401 RepID=A0ACC1HCG2_9FUNG|nr:hypothetical protein EV182_003670 [Spiromyces aspiralis]